MDNNRLAWFLANCTSQGFRRSLRISPHAALTAAGFSPAEASVLAAGVIRRRSGHKFEWLEWNESFQKIDTQFQNSNKMWQDDWTS